MTEEHSKIEQRLREEYRQIDEPRRLGAVLVDGFEQERVPRQVLPAGYWYGAGVFASALVLVVVFGLFNANHVENAEGLEGDLAMIPSIGASGVSALTSRAGELTQLTSRSPTSLSKGQPLPEITIPSGGVSLSGLSADSES